MLGEKELIKLFPDFADLVQPSGIDLTKRFGKSERN